MRGWILAVTFTELVTLSACSSPTSCPSGFADCDGVASNGCEVNLAINVDHCSACGSACPRESGTPNCIEGVCGYSACDGTLADCDGRAANGCEIDTATSASHCGGCGKACTVAGGAARCAAGVCVLDACDETHRDCNQLPDDGCEVDITTTANCGACGRACTNSHGASACVSGACVPACASGFGDCNGGPEDGCETPLATSAQHCGACGRACSSSHTATAPTCAGGLCTGAQCEDGFSNCTTPAAPLADDGCESQPANDSAHCGTCGTACDNPAGTTSCVNGACAPVCATGFGDCDGSRANGCETATTTVNHCGACGVPCAPAHGVGSCASGTCTIVGCSPGFDDCDGNPANGCETDVRTSSAHCGTCQRACVSANGMNACVSGECSPTCSIGFADCDSNLANGCETGTRTLSNCGSCQTTCGRPHATASCASGTCELGTCDPGFASCDGADSNGCEQPLNTLMHCGGCNLGCSRLGGMATCDAGTCALAGCQPGLGSCDGVEANGCEQPLNTLAHCGACATPCARANAAATCGGGACQLASCNAGFADCDLDDSTGCEQPTTTLAHCGGCNLSCARTNATATCASGVCAIASCNPGASSCDGQDFNGCEVNHAAPLETCATASSVGSAPASAACAFDTCTASWRATPFSQLTGVRSAWFRATMTPYTTTCASEHQARLSSPVGTNYDLYVYSACGTLIGSSMSNSTSDVLTISRPSSSANVDYWIEVRYVSGASCSSWTLALFAHGC